MYPRIALGLVVAGVLCLVVGAFAALSLHGFEGELTGGGQAATDAADPAEHPADGQDGARRTEGGRGNGTGASPAAELSGAPARAAAGPVPPPEASDAQDEKTEARE